MKKLLLFSAFCIIILCIVMVFTYRNFLQQESLLMHVSDKIVIMDDLPDFDAESDKPLSDKNIFFIETSGITKGDLMLKSRQGCAVESAAKMNPNMTVYLLLVSRSKVPNQSTKFFDQLRRYPNVRIRRVYLDKYMENTPLEKWYKGGAWKDSEWPTSHMSDVLRYLTLWKYGGIYLDLDVVVTKSLEDLKNFAGIQDEETVNSAVIGFDCSPLGRFMATLCIHDLKMNFRGDSWAHNGPGVITRMLQKFCSTKKVEELTTKRCHGFEIFSPSIFYPIRYANWAMYFKDEEKERTIELVKEARVIHLWNKLSDDEEVRVESDVPYAILARRHCPRVFYNSGIIF